MNRCKYYSNDGHCKKYSDRETSHFCVEGPCWEERESFFAKVMSWIENLLVCFYDKFLAEKEDADAFKKPNYCKMCIYEDGNNGFCTSCVYMPSNFRSKLEFQPEYWERMKTNGEKLADCVGNEKTRPYRICAVNHPRGHYLLLSVRQTRQEA